MQCFRMFVEPMDLICRAQNYLFFQRAQLHLLKLPTRPTGVLYRNQYVSLGFLQKFEEAAGEFNGALGSRHPLILSPDMSLNNEEPFKKVVGPFELIS